MAIYYVDGAVGSDSNAGTSPGSGNAWATIGKAASTCVAGDTCYIKASANYTLTSTATFSASGSAASGPITFEGYTTTPGARDGRPTITSATNSVALLSLSAAAMLQFRHLKLTHTAATRGPGFAGAGAANSTSIAIDDCLIDGCSIGVDGSSRRISGAISGTTIRNCTSHGMLNDGVGMLIVDGCLFLANGGDGWQWNATSTTCMIARQSIFAANGGNGFYDTATSRTQTFTFLGCTVAGNTGDGIRIDASTGSVALGLESCILYGNGGYGVNTPSQTVNAMTARQTANRNNAYGSNTSGNHNLNPAGFGEIALSAGPFTNSSSGDYSLNTAAGGGAACRAVGFPGSFPGGTTTGYLDLGAVQHQDAGGGGGTGGFRRISFGGGF